jgi:hypothetical protein
VSVIGHTFFFNTTWFFVRERIDLDRVDEIDGPGVLSKQKLIIVEQSSIEIQNKGKMSRNRSVDGYLYGCLLRKGASILAV